MPNRSSPPRPDPLLRRAREARGWSQEQLAEVLGTNAFTISRWERGQAVPRPHFRQHLCELFACSPEDLGLLPKRDPQPQRPQLWHVPALRNPFFTGRAAVLDHLKATLSAGNAAAVTQAITGLGGVGKTQLALEYAYRCRDQYQAVFWVTADTREAFLADLGAIAALLDLPEYRQAQHDRLIGAFKRWLETEEHWLLVLDNAEDFALVRAVLPTTNRGHALLTTRVQATRPLAEPVGLEELSLEEGTRFLLARAGLLALNGQLDQMSVEVRGLAAALTTTLGGLPLALDQAGAYIEETACSLADYLCHFQTHQRTLLQRRGTLGWDHPASVLTTFALAFLRLQATDPVAAHLLCCCAFLAPDGIPEALLEAGASELGPGLAAILINPIARDSTIGALRQFSLVRRDAATRSLFIHRLVQAVLRESLTADEQRQWAECVVRAVDRAFPAVSFETWDWCQQCFPHVQVCAELMRQWDLALPEGERLLTRAGAYLTERAQYGSAEALLKQGLEICERAVGPAHPGVAECLLELAHFYDETGQYAQAELLLQRALAIQEQTLDPTDPAIARNYYALALAAENQGHYERAKPFYQQALAIYQALGWDEYLETARTLGSLGVLYRVQNQYIQAEPLLQRALAILERLLAPEDPEVAVGLNNLAVLYNNQGQYAQAEPLFRRALAIREKVLGLEHPDLAANLYNLGILYASQGDYRQAEALLKRALEIVSKALGPQQQGVAHCLNQLGWVALQQGREQEAEPLLEQALTIYEQRLGDTHERVGTCLHNLALLYTKQGRYAQAQVGFERAVHIFERTVGPEQVLTAQSLCALARLSQFQGNEQQAETLYQQALAIYEHRLGKEHPKTAQVLVGLADLYGAQGRVQQAVPLCQQALVIQERLLGPTHPDVAASLEVLGLLFQALGQAGQAEPLFRQALHIRELILGPTYPDGITLREQSEGVLQISRARGKTRKLRQ